MAEPGPTKKKVPSAKELANLRPNPRTLRGGGSKPHEFVIQPHLDFLTYLLDGATHKDAWRGAGLPSSEENPYALMKRPLIQQTMKELAEKRKDQSVDTAAKRREEREMMLHNELGH